MIGRRIMTALVLIGVAIAFAVGWDRARTSTDPHADAPGGWAVGGERTYACELATHARLPAGGELVALRMKGRLALTVIATAPDLVVRAQYSGDTLSLSGTATGAEASRETVQRSLTQPFHLTYRSTGALAGVRAAPDTIPFVVGLFREIGSTLRIAAPGAPGEEWEATEEDSGGAYVASYRVLAGPRDAPRRIGRHKQRYVDGATTVVASQLELEFEDTRVLHGVRSHETLRAARGPLPELEVTTVLTLAYVRSADRRRELVGWLNQDRRLPDVAANDAAFTSAIDRAAVAGWQYADILAILRAHSLAKQAGTPSKEAKERAARAYAALTALLRLHPSQLASVRTQIVENSPLTSTLIAALRDAGSPEAQGVLRELLVEPRVAAHRPRIARGLSLVPQPTAETVEALQELQADPLLGVQATYGLGSALYRIQNGDPALGGKVLGHLLAQLAQADTVSRTVELLNALGNAGHPDAIAAISPYLRDADEILRAAAARALRRIPGSHADELLGRASMDPSADVRGAAVEALTQRPPSAVLAGALAPRLLDEPEFSVRARAVHIAAGWLAELRTVLLGPLTRVAEHDVSPDLRRIARAALD